MKVEKIYTYPVKGLRAVELDSATVTKHGFPYDRRFMLHQVIYKPDRSTTLRKMQVDSHPELVLFHQTLRAPTSPTSGDGEITLTFRPPHDSSSATTPPVPQTWSIPLEPDVAGLERLEIDLHGSPTPAYRMPTACNAAFAACLGYDVVLAYLGPHYRAVLFSGADRPSLIASGTRAAALTASAASHNPRIPGSWPGNGAIDDNNETDDEDNTVSEGTDQAAPGITFADVAPYLIVSARSMDDVHPRLHGDGAERMDITKFRPNLIISAAEEPWEEDYWRELEIGVPEAKGERQDAVTTGTTTTTGTTRLVCVHNCGRCNSINVDYETGKVGTGEAGKMLKKLQRDRRVDPGAKWSPIFGRYAFLMPGCDGNEIRVGDEVVVKKRNTERTRFDWAGLST